MKILLVLALASTSLAGEVIELTKNNFNSVLAENPNVLVEFYAPWCGHCKSLAPEYEKAANLIEDVVLAKVDATQETSLSEKFGVEGFPTLIFFKNGEKLEEYDGGRTADGIIEWCEERVGEPYKTLTETELDREIEKAHEAKKAAIVLYAPSDSAEVKIFANFAARKRGYGIYMYVESSKLSLQVSHADEGVTGLMESDLIAEGMDDFLLTESFPLFGNIDTSNYERYSAPNSLNFNLVWFCFSKSTAANDIKNFGPVIRDTAKALRGEYYFVHLDTEEFDEHAQKYLGCASYPSMVVQTDLQGKASRYVWAIEEKNDITRSGIRGFIDDVRNGAIKAYLRGDSPPEFNDGPVRVVVTSTFEQEVLLQDKDVLLEVYAPWCGHCKKLAPIYDRLARLVKAQEAGNHLVIAKLEGTGNETPLEEFQWEGFPTLFFVKAGERKPQVVRVGRTLKDLVGFLKAHSSFTAVKKLEILSGPLDFKEVREFVENPGSVGEKVVKQIKELLAEHDRNSDYEDEGSDLPQGLDEDEYEDDTKTEDDDDWDDDL